MPIDEYPNSRFESIALAPDGHELSLHYFDWSEREIQVRLTYTISLSGPPTRLTQHNEDCPASSQLSFTELPHRVIADALAWLRPNLEASRQSDTTAMHTILQSYFTVLTTTHANA